MAMVSSTVAWDAPSRMRAAADLAPPAMAEWRLGLPPRATMIAARMDDLPLPVGEERGER